MPPTKAVLFDLDNTLIDFLKFKRVSYEAAIEAMRDAGLRLAKEEALSRLYALFEKHGMEDGEIFQKLLQEMTGKVDYKVLAAGVNAYRRARMLVPYPGVRRTLLALREKRLKLAIVTDAPRLKAWIRLTAMGLEDFFDVVVALEDTGELKPSALPFKAALERLALSPEECLMVGDNPEKDLVGAKSLGMRTCFAKYGGRENCERWDHEIGSVEELLKIL